MKFTIFLTGVSVGLIMGLLFSILMLRTILAEPEFLVEPADLMGKSFDINETGSAYSGWVFYEDCENEIVRIIYKTKINHDGIVTAHIKSKRKLDGSSVEGIVNLFYFRVEDKWYLIKVQPVSVKGKEGNK